jgi:hypothetical protein
MVAISLMETAGDLDLHQQLMLTLTLQEKLQINMLSLL